MKVGREASWEEEFQWRSEREEVIGRGQCENYGNSLYKIMKVSNNKN